MPGKENTFEVFAKYNREYDSFRSASAQMAGVDARERTNGRANALKTLKDHFGNNLPVNLSNSDGIIDNELSKVLDISETNLHAYFTGNLEEIISDAPGKPLSETARILMYDPVSKKDHKEAGELHARVRELSSLLQGEPSELVEKTVKQFVTDQTRSIKQNLETRYPHAKAKAATYAQAAEAVYASGYTPEKAFAYVATELDRTVKAFEKTLGKDIESYGREALLGTVKRYISKEKNIAAAIETAYSVTKPLSKK